MIFHKHHIIPKHAGGPDDPSNTELITIPVHAERHRILFEQYGRWQDEVAWKGLSGMITHEEAILYTQKFPRSAEYKRKLSESLRGVPKSAEHKQKMKCIVKSVEHKQKLSESAKERLKHKENHPRYGVIVSNETKQKISESKKGIKIALKSAEWKQNMSKIMREVWARRKEGTT